MLVDFINRQNAGTPLFEAVTQAGVARFGPIILTSVTTFVGLILMTNDDPETFMFIPMAISLFLACCSPSITLFLVPSLYLMLEDFLSLWGRRSKSWAEAPIKSKRPGGHHKWPEYLSLGERAPEKVGAPYTESDAIASAKGFRGSQCSPCHQGTPHLL